MKRVIIASPYSGEDWEIERNVDYASHCVAHSISLGEAPIAFHIFIPRLLDDENPEEREIGMSVGRSWIQVADCLAVYGDLGVSPGMEREILLADALHLEISHRTIGWH